MLSYPAVLSYLALPSLALGSHPIPSHPTVCVPAACLHICVSLTVLHSHSHSHSHTGTLAPIYQMPNAKCPTSSRVGLMLLYRRSTLYLLALSSDDNWCASGFRIQDSVTGAFILVPRLWNSGLALGTVDSQKRKTSQCTVPVTLTRVAPQL